MWWWILLVIVVALIGALLFVAARRQDRNGPVHGVDTLRHSTRNNPHAHGS